MFVVVFRDAFHADISNREFTATLRDLTGIRRRGIDGKTKTELRTSTPDVD